MKKKNIISMDEVRLNHSQLQPLMANNLLDEFFSFKGGIPAATSYMISGAPGVGKTTVILNELSELQNAGYKVLFISAEMTQTDMLEYVERFPLFGKIPMLFSSQLDNPKAAIEEALDEGFDAVLGDSIAEIISSIQADSTESKALIEKWLIDLIQKHNEADNEEKRHTTFFLINQVTKSGVFSGSNRIKHLLTGSLELKFADNNASGHRYMEFTKNRRGPVYKRLYYEFDVSGKVILDEAQFKGDAEIEAIVQNDDITFSNDAQKLNDILAKEKAKDDPFSFPAKKNKAPSELEDLIRNVLRKKKAGEPRDASINSIKVLTGWGPKTAAEFYDSVTSELTHETFEQFQKEKKEEKDDDIFNFNEAEESDDDDITFYETDEADTFDISSPLYFCNLNEIGPDLEKVALEVTKHLDYEFEDACFILQQKEGIEIYVTHQINEALDLKIALENCGAKIEISKQSYNLN